MKRKAIKAGFAVSALALAISPAMAAELRFDGFASFVAGQVIDEDEMAGDNYRGYDGDLGFDNNSLFAVQVRADLQEKLSATAQIIAKGTEGYDARFNWAYMTYEFTNELTLKAGRFRAPLFLYSEFLDVGYAYHWIEPPRSVYELGGLDSNDGVQLDYTTDLGGWTSSFTVLTSRAKAELSELGTLDSPRTITASWTLNYDWFTFHIVHSDSDTTINADAFDQLAGGLAQAVDLVTQAPLISQEAIDNMLVESDKSTYDGIGIAIDTGTFFAIAEVTRSKVENSFTADPATAGYISMGMRFGKWTPYLTAESVESDLQEERRDAIIDPLNAQIALLEMGLPFLPPQGTDYQSDVTRQTYAGYTQLRDGVNAIFAQTEREELTYSVGVRYDFHPAAAFKVEYMLTEDKVNDVKPSAIAVAVDLVY